MKNQNNMTRQEYKKGAICGGLLAAFAAWFIHCVLDNREIPIVNEFVRRDALPGCILIGVVILIIGFCVMVRNISRLNQLDRQDRNRGAGARQSGGQGNTAGSSSYAYYYCEKCGKHLRIAGGKGQFQVTCPMCGHRFIVNR